MLKRLITNLRRFQLSFWIVFVTIGFFLSSAAILWLLGSESILKAKTVRSEFVARDLRELVGRFEADERYVLEHNLKNFLTERREMSPLLLPRQYFVGLPPNYSRAIPRQPPRNCFVDISPAGVINQKIFSTPDKICSYFADNASFGNYLFLAADIYDNSVVPLMPGDVSLTADALRITVEKTGYSATWWLTLQSPKERSTRGRFEINAIRENSNGTHERDKRVEGWAYVQRQVDGTQVIRIIARIDFNEFFLASAQSPTLEQWPPVGWRNLRLKLARKEVAISKEKANFLLYQPDGRSHLSLSHLADSIFDSYSELTVLQTMPTGAIAEYPVEPTITRQKEWRALQNHVRFINDDLVIAADKVTMRRLLPDTNLQFVVKHPGIIIERVVWKTFLALLVVSVIGFVFAWYFYQNLLKPIFTLTRSIRSLVHAPKGKDDKLPYSNQENEFGTLARGFNDLLAETRRRAQREAENQRIQQAEDERQRKEAIQSREENLKLIGHEIRSPLQALISLHETGSKSRPFLDRIHKALEYLQGTLSAQQAISERELDLREIDIATFLQVVARQAPLAKIDNVLYSGPERGVMCRLDIESVEDCIENILKNADRFRMPRSPIHIDLTQDDKFALIKIVNQGPSIAEENIEKIFDYGMSTTAKNAGSGDGIGLYVARQYLRLMHATISARNVSEGVCFEIRIPLFFTRRQPSELNFSAVVHEERQGTSLSLT